MIRMRVVGLACFILAVGSSCEKEPRDKRDGGVFVSREVKWMTGVIDGEPLASTAKSDANLVVDGAFIANGMGADGPTLVALGVKTGARRWTWSNIFGDPALTSIRVAHSLVQDGQLLYTVGGRKYCINTGSGETIWRSWDSTGVALQGNDAFQLGDYYYQEGCSQQIDEVCAMTVHRGTFDGPELEEVIVTPIPLDSIRGNRSVDITSFDLVPGSDRLVAVVYQHIVEGARFDNEFISYLGLYDLEAATWVYSGVQLHERQGNGVALAPLQITEDFVYIAVAETIMCYEITTGAEIWRRRLPREIWTSGFVISEGVCAINCENKTMYGLDALTGRQLWTVPTAQLCSPLEGRVINGVVYFVCTSDHSVFGVDLREGRLVWKLDEEEMFRGKRGFQVSVSAMQPTADLPGLVFLRAGDQALCVEAHR